MTDLRHFKSIEEAVIFITNEALMAMQADFERMLTDDREHYTDADRQAKRLQIADVLRVIALLKKVAPTLSATNVRTSVSTIEPVETTRGKRYEPGTH